jgi:cytochrome c oxidase subunit IV
MANAHDAAHGVAHGESEDAIQEGHYGHISVGTYIRVFIGLMVLMILTVAAWWVEKNVLAMPGWLAVGIAMAIAIAKTALIIYYFMHVKVSSKLTQAFAVSAFVFLAIMFIVTMGDYVARGWPPQSGPLP